MNRTGGSFRQFLLLGTISVTLNTCADLLAICSLLRSARGYVLLPIYAGDNALQLA